MNDNSFVNDSFILQDNGQWFWFCQWFIYSAG